MGNSIKHKTKTPKTSEVKTITKYSSRRYLVENSILFVLSIVVLVVIVSLSETHHFKKKSSNDQNATNHSSQCNCNEMNNYPPGSIEREILCIPEYKYTSRENEYTCEIEKPVIDKLSTEIHMEKINLNSDNNIHHDISTFIQEIVIVQRKNIDPNDPNLVLKQLDNLNIPSSITIHCLKSVENADHTIGQYLSHVSVLSKFINKHKNILILDEDFKFNSNINLDTIHNELKNVMNILGNRWDVIKFSQNPKIIQHLGINVYKLQDDNCSGGYLVNSNYIHRILQFLIQEIRLNLQKKHHYRENFNLNNVYSLLQVSDMWVGFEAPIGYNQNSKNKKNEPIISKKPLSQKIIAICNIATGKYKQYVQNIHRDCHLKFLKCHTLKFFLFTDEPNDFVLNSHEKYEYENYILTKTKEGSDLFLYKINRKGFPGDTLYRYHYMLKAETELLQCHHIFYMDVDYRVYQHLSTDEFLVDGIVVTRHLHNITETFRGNHIGSPETRPESTACINKNEKMNYYVCGGFQGGSAQAFINMCHEIKKNIDKDDNNSIMAVYHDESHLNRYVLSHPPTKVLDQAYIYAERCLNMDCFDPMCTALRRCNIDPILIPLEKDHHHVRS
jgi:GR25 family glycosyltransferase involved in LPS biosynthesis